VSADCSGSAGIVVVVTVVLVAAGAGVSTTTGAIVIDPTRALTAEVLG
jgi:hypothetical protein